MKNLALTLPRGAAPLGLALLVALSGCAVRPRYGYGYAYAPTTYASVGVGAGDYDTSRCRWDWIDDGFGGYQQLNCWSPQYSTWRPYYDGGAYGRMYPDWYWGARVPVAPLPPAVAPPALPAQPYYGGGPGYVAPPAYGNPGHAPPPFRGGGAYGPVAPPAVPAR